MSDLSAEAVQAAPREIIANVLHDVEGEGAQDANALTLADDVLHGLWVCGYVVTPAVADSAAEQARAEERRKVADEIRSIAADPYRLRDWLYHRGLGQAAEAARVIRAVAQSAGDDVLRQARKADHG